MGSSYMYSERKIFRQQGCLSKTIAHFMKKLYTCWPTMIVERKRLNKQVNISPYSLTHSCYKIYSFFVKNILHLDFVQLKRIKTCRKTCLNTSESVKKARYCHHIIKYISIKFREIKKSKYLRVYHRQKRGVGWIYYFAQNSIYSFLSFCLGVSFQEKTIIFQDQFLRMPI